MEKPKKTDQEIFNDLRAGMDYVGLAEKYHLSAEEFVSFRKRNSHELGLMTQELLSNALHPASYILPYIEKALSEENIPIVEQHLAVCLQCSEEAEELKRIICGLTMFKKEIFCPEPWECYDFAQKPQSPDRNYAEHIAQCSLCRSDVEEMQTAAEKMPDAIADAFRKNYGRGNQSGLFTQMVRRWLGYFADIRALSGIVAAAAAVLLVFVMYPASDMGPVPALSSVRWEHSAGSLIAKDFSGKKPKTRLAVIIETNDPKSLPQPTIDELYRAVDPSRFSDLHDFISPADIKEFMENHNLNASETDSIVNGVMERMKARVLVVTVSSAGSGFSVSAQVKEPGKTPRLVKRTVSDQNELPVAIKALSESSIESSSPADEQPAQDR